MKRILAVASILVLLIAGVAIAADVAPTLDDVYKAILEIKTDIAQLKADGFTKADSSGQLAVAKSEDGLVVLEITSLVASPDAAVIGMKVTNNSKDKYAKPNFLMSTTLVSAGKEINILHDEGLGETLPGTSKSYLLLTEPLPKGAAEITMRTSVYDSKTYSKIMEPTLTIRVK